MTLEEMTWEQRFMEAWKALITMELRAEKAESEASYFRALVEGQMKLVVTKDLLETATQETAERIRRGQFGRLDRSHVSSRRGRK